jgi:hypothetical protein
MTNEQLKNNHNTAIRVQTADNSIDTDVMADQLDNLVDYVDQESEKPKDTRIYAYVPDAGWKIGDIWIYNNFSNPGTTYFRRITDITNPSDPSFEIILTLYYSSGIWSITEAGDNFQFQIGTDGITGEAYYVMSGPNARYLFTKAGIYIQSIDEFGETIGTSDINLSELTKAVQKATDPIATEIPTGYAKIYKNTTFGAVKLWYNDGGTLKSITFS